MILDIIFYLLGGIGLFFLGMKTMSDGLKRLAGDRLKNILYHATKHRIVGVGIGALVTLLVQSSSATTVMVVGFVNAGLLALKQAITVIMGANIGTTFTAWLVSSLSVFKITKYALPAIGIGFFISILSKRYKRQGLGAAILGFGLLFVGLSFMKDAFDPLKDSQALKDIFVMFAQHPILGIVVGIIFTILLQSSSATIAITQVLAFNGIITFEAAIPIILGDNIGTTITAQMAAIGGNLNARRAAMSHTLFNFIGVLYMLVFLYTGYFVRFVDFIIPGKITLTNVMFHIAVAHSTFNVINTLVFLPFVKYLEKVCIFLVPKREDTIEPGTQYLEEHLLDTPSLALEQVHQEILYMLKVSRKATFNAISAFKNGDLRLAQKTDELETVTDNLQSEITHYLVELSQRSLDPEQSEEMPVLIHNVNDIERIGDHAQNLSELARRKIGEGLSFSANAMLEIEEIEQVLGKMFDDVREAILKGDKDLAKRVLLMENSINEMQDRFKKTHFNRLNEGQCMMASGFVFVEFIDNLEKIGDRMTNLAQSVLGRMRWELHHTNPKSNSTTKSEASS